MPHCAQLIQAIDEQLADLEKERRRLSAARACLRDEPVVYVPDGGDEPEEADEGAATTDADAVFGVVEEAPPSPNGMVQVLNCGALMTPPPPSPYAATETAGSSRPGGEALVDVPEAVAKIVAEASLGTEVANPPIPAHVLADAAPPEKPKPTVRHPPPAAHPPWRTGPMPKPPPLRQEPKPPPSPPGHRDMNGGGSFYEPVIVPETIREIVESIMADGNEHTAIDIAARALELKKEVNPNSINAYLSMGNTKGIYERTAPSRYRLRKGTKAAG
jgi:hypothetical protein